MPQPSLARNQMSKTDCVLQLEDIKHAYTPMSFTATPANCGCLLECATLPSDRQLTWRSRSGILAPPVNCNRNNWILVCLFLGMLDCRNLWHDKNRMKARANHVSDTRWTNFGYVYLQTRYNGNNGYNFWPVCNHSPHIIPSKVTQVCLVQFNANNKECASMGNQLSMKVLEHTLKLGFSELVSQHQQTLIALISSRLTLPLVKTHNAEGTLEWLPVLAYCNGTTWLPIEEDLRLHVILYTTLWVAANQLHSVTESYGFVLSSSSSEQTVDYNHGIIFFRFYSNYSPALCN